MTSEIYFHYKNMKSTKISTQQLSAKRKYVVGITEPHPSLWNDRT